MNVSKTQNGKTSKVKLKISRVANESESRKSWDESLSFPAIVCDEEYSSLSLERIKRDAFNPTD